MGKRQKMIIVGVIIGLIAYFGGFGSMVFTGSSGTGSAAASETVITKINMQSTTAVADAALVQSYADLLTNTFRFDNGNVGKITYFYGGKAGQVDPETGLDVRFSELAWGTSSDGTQFLKPYGLDCSGYVTYVMNLAGVDGFPDGSSYQYQIGESTTTLSEAQNGDLLIYRDSLTNQITHIGMCFWKNGTLYDYHCNAADNGVASRPVNGVGLKADGYYWQEIVHNPYVGNEVE